MFSCLFLQGCHNVTKVQLYTLKTKKKDVVYLFLNNYVLDKHVYKHLERMLLHTIIQKKKKSHNTEKVQYKHLSIIQQNINKLNNA